jgi:hypothetical protein
VSMASLEDFLANKPLNPRMAALMRGVEEDDEPEESAAERPQNYADGMPVTKADREHLRRMVMTAGWGVLLKLLDTELQGQEDAARRISLAPAVPDGEITAAWKNVAAAKLARNRLVALVDSEIEKLKENKAGRFDSANSQ